MHGFRDQLVTWQIGLVNACWQLSVGNCPFGSCPRGTCLDTVILASKWLPNCTFQCFALIFRVWYFGVFAKFGYFQIFRKFGYTFFFYVATLMARYAVFVPRHLSVPFAAKRFTVFELVCQFAHVRNQHTFAGNFHRRVRDRTALQDAHLDPS